MLPSCEMCYKITIILFNLIECFTDVTRLKCFPVRGGSRFPSARIKWLKTFIFISETRKHRRHCCITVMFLLGPGASLPQATDSVVSLQSGGITVLRLCALALLQKKKSVIVCSFIRGKKRGSVKRRQAAPCLRLFPLERRSK